MTVAVPSQPRPAATVVIVRPAEPVPQVLLLRRHAKAVFASHYVFPGGVVEACDAGLETVADGPAAAESNALLGVDNAGEYYSAAIREAFEESGILFARDTDGEWAFSRGDIDQPAIDEYRARLNDGRLDWHEFLAGNRLRLACDALHYIAYWVTPSVQQKRFSTRFFLGVLPAGQQARHDRAELTDSRWMTATEALEERAAGRIKLMNPTRSTLREIATFDSVDLILTWARQRGESGDARVLPAFVEVDGRWRVVMPGHPLYPADYEA